MSVTCQKMNRRELLNYINEISFAVDDTKLFLDTHLCMLNNQVQKAHQLEVQT